MSKFKTNRALEAAVKSNRGLVTEAEFQNILSLKLNGSSKAISLDALATALASTIKGSWSIRVKLVDNTPSAVERVIGFANTANNTITNLSITPAGKIGFAMCIGGTPQWNLQTNAGILTSGQWAQIGGFQDGVDPRIVVNGAIATHAFITELDKTKWFNDMVINNGRAGCINFDGGGNSGFLDANMDELRFWNTNLSVAQWITHYNGGPALGISKEPLQGNLIAGYSFENDILPAIEDTKGNLDGAGISLVSGDFVEDVQT